MKSKKNPSAGTKAESSTKVDAKTSSHTCIKPNVGSSSGFTNEEIYLSTQNWFPISDRMDLSKIEHHFSYIRLGDEEIKVPYVPLFNYLRCVEALQSAENSVKTLMQKVELMKQQVNQ